MFSTARANAFPPSQEIDLRRLRTVARKKIEKFFLDQALVS